MLQKILVVLVLALAAGLGWSVWEARTSRLVMRDEMMKLQEQIGVLVGKSTRPAPLDPGLYYMSGKVQLNGPFSMTSGLTLSRALAAARCEVGAKRASVTRKLIDRTETKYFDIATLTESNAFDPPLMADDLVVVD